MRISAALALALGVCGLRFVSGEPVLLPNAVSVAAVAFHLSSPAFAEGTTIPPAYTCDGANRAPALLWKGAPTGTRSLALVMDDPDAPGGIFTHWVLFDIPGHADRLPEGFQVGQVGVSGRNDFGTLGYGGPCPPRGVHRYFFTLRALSVPTLSLPEGAGRRQVEERIDFRVLGQAQLMGRYERK